MIAGVKFCGGCNPKYDRKFLYESLKNEYKNIEFQTVSSNSDSFEYDFIIVFCRCTVKCAEYKKYKTKTKYIVISSNEDIHKFRNEIEEIYYIQEKS